MAREKRVVAATIIRVEDAPGGVDSRCMDVYAYMSGHVYDMYEIRLICTRCVCRSVGCRHYGWCSCRVRHQKGEGSRPALAPTLQSGSLQPLTTTLPPSRGWDGMPHPLSNFPPRSPYQHTVLECTVAESGHRLYLGKVHLPRYIIGFPFAECFMPHLLGPARIGQRSQELWSLVSSSLLRILLYSVCTWYSVDPVDQPE